MQDIELSELAKFFGEYWELCKKFWNGGLVVTEMNAIEEKYECPFVKNLMYSLMMHDHNDKRTLEGLNGNQD